MKNNKWRVIRITEYVSAIELTTAEGAVFNRGVYPAICIMSKDLSEAIRLIACELMITASLDQNKALHFQQVGRAKRVSQ